MGSRQSHTFLVYLLSDLVLLQNPLCIPHPVNYCSLLSSRPPPPSHGVTVDTWHLETACSSPTKCCTSAGQQRSELEEPTTINNYAKLIVQGLIRLNYFSYKTFLDTLL